jgi:hypothetical protein
MSGSAEKGSSTPATAPAPLRADNWPLRDTPRRATALLAVFLVLAIAGGWLSGDGTMGALCLLVLLAATWKVWIPVKCQIGPRGVTIRFWRCQRHLAWSQIDRFEVRHHGVLVVLDTDRSVLSYLRSVYLPWRGDLDDVRRTCEHYHPYFSLSDAQAETLTDPTAGRH